MPVSITILPTTCISKCTVTFAEAIRTAFSAELLSPAQANELLDTGHLKELLDIGDTHELLETSVITELLDTGHTHVLLDDLVRDELERFSSDELELLAIEELELFGSEELDISAILLELAAISQLPTDTDWFVEKHTLEFFSVMLKIPDSSCVPLHDFSGAS